MKFFSLSSLSTAPLSLFILVAYALWSWNNERETRGRQMPNGFCRAIWRLTLPIKVAELVPLGCPVLKQNKSIESQLYDGSKSLKLLYENKNTQNLPSRVAVNANSISTHRIYNRAARIPTSGVHLVINWPDRAVVGWCGVYKRTLSDLLHLILGEKWSVCGAVAKDGEVTKIGRWGVKGFREWEKLKLMLVRRLPRCRIRKRSKVQPIVSLEKVEGS